MFGRLKNIFKKAEAEVEEKLEGTPIESAEETIISPPEEIDDYAKRAAGEVKDQALAAQAPKKPISEQRDDICQKTKLAKPGRAERVDETVVGPIEELDDSRKKAIEEIKSEMEKESDERVEKRVKVGIKSAIKTKLGVKTRLDESEIDNITWSLQIGLMESDVAMEVADAITGKLKAKLEATEFKDPKAQIRQIFKEILVGILESGGRINFVEFVKNHKKPVKIIFFGVNGSGKTTTIAKIASMLKREGLSVVVAAGDTFRAGAQEQLAKHAETVGVRVVHHQRGGDAAAVVFDAIKHAEANNIDVILADTSGRMQSDADLMGEMEKIVRVNKPDLKVFVGDALTGNDAVEQARRFDERIGIDAAILAKADASKGGAALSVSYVTGKPIIFLGVGQGYGDLQAFDAKRFVDQII